MNNFLLLCIAIALTACASQQSSRFSHLTNSELGSISKRVLKEEYIQYCKRLLPITQEISQRAPSDTNNKKSMHYAEYQCAIRQLRWKDAYTSMILSGKYSELLGFEVAYKAKRFEDAVARLEEIARNPISTNILKIGSSVFNKFYQEIPSDHSINLKLRAISAMAYSPHFYKFDHELRATLSIGMLNHEITNNTLNDIDKWVPNILFPNIYLQMLTDKKYENIWAVLEKEVGENFKKSTTRYANVMSNHFNKDVKNKDAYQKFAFALLFNGQFKKVIELVSTPEIGDHITQQEAWALNAKGLALDATNRKDEADYIFELLATNPVNIRNKYWLINFTINHSERLKRYQKWQESYDAAVYAGKFSGSPYAKIIILEIKVCTLNMLNRKEEANSLLDTMFIKRKDSYESSIHAMLCGKRYDLAVDIAIEALNDDAHRSRILEYLQAPEFSFYFMRSDNIDMYDPLYENSKFIRAFNKKGRFLPNKLMLKPKLN